MPKYLVLYTKRFELLDTNYPTVEFFEDIVKMLDYENSHPKGTLISASVWIYSKTYSRYEKLYDKEWYYN